MWRHMIHFAIEHDFDKGDSQWHIFDSSTAAVKVYTDQQTTEMDRGHHLILTTWPSVTAFTGASKNVDLIWNAPFLVGQGSSARGNRGPWGCDTAVSWLKEKFIPLLIDLHWPATPHPTRLQQIIRRSQKSSFTIRYAIGLATSLRPQESGHLSRHLRRSC